MNPTILMSATATCSITCSESEPAEFILPDLLSGCHYPLRFNAHRDPVSRASEQWTIDRAPFTEDEITAFRGLLAGELVAACHPDADASHLRVSMDFVNWLFTVDDWTDEFDVDDTLGMRECCISVFRDPMNFETEKHCGQMCKSYFTRFKETAGPGCTERFIRAMDLFFVAVAKQADDRVKGHVPDLESFITMRRDTSCCKPVFALIEYAACIDLPDEVVSHPVIMAMEEAANDLATWSNDIFSYNLEQSRHDTHNMITVLMHEQGLGLQSAADHLGRLCMGAIQRFEDNRVLVPSWGEELDTQVTLYVDGLQNWIVSSLHWPFNSTRYFGKDGHIVKRDRIIKLFPKRPL